ncbi:hypothetical protein [Lactobacillus paraplantarum] [Lactiplantibacillus mudanjiangensis]|uniref:hypothetical protein n=1 Tax=Lactiplantibacillus mudanjiangensis TaxID=1296538 RepID=UPI00101564F7|nr:hypothetical protein [Lactobacillus paraplantarum] [Lactiplantibacillus mudanjiangensis]
MKLILQRIDYRIVTLYFFIALILPIVQVIQSLNRRLLVSNTFFDSPYTKWIGIDSFHFSSTAFYLILPLLAALPVSTLIRKDLESGFLAQLQLRLSVKSVFKSYLFVTALLGAAIIVIPLLVNFLLYFLLIPNIHPDNLLNSNILVINRNTLLVGLFFQHPFMHVLLSIIFAGFWGAMFAIFCLGWSLLINNRFVAMTAGFVLQLAILLVHGMTDLSVTFVPMYFVTETSQNDIQLWVVLLMTMLMGVGTAVLAMGGYRYRIIE